MTNTTPASVGADALRSKLFEIVTDVYDRSMQIDDAVIEIMDIVPSAAQDAPAVSAGDAVFAFASMLTALPHVVPFGSAAWATPGVELASAFNAANGLFVSLTFPDGLVFPKIEGELLACVEQAAPKAAPAPTTWPTDSAPTPEREFAEWLNQRRGFPVSEVFHEIMHKFAARAPAAPAHPTAGIWVPTELAERVQETIGEFLMDHGWRQQDMDTSDALDAVLAAAPKAVQQFGAGDAVFAFASMLTALPRVVQFGSAAWSTPGVELAMAFNAANGLSVSRDFPSGLVFPKFDGDLLAVIEKAAAPQPAVQQGDAEDAARLDFMIEHRAYVVSDPDACPGYWLHFVHKETGHTWVQGDEHTTPRAAIDAARAAKEGSA